MATAKQPFLTIIVPVYNEEKGLEIFYKEITKVLKIINKPYEIIFVNDGSSDNSLNTLRLFAQQNKAVKIIHFSRNFGHQIAITAGMDAAQGQAVITIDADLQDTPKLIIKMIKKWKEGYEVIYAKRHTRQDNFLKKITASIFYRLLNKLSNTKIPVDAGDYRLMDRKVVEVMKQIREHSRYVRGLTSWVGFRQTPVKFNRGNRVAGETHYSLKKMMKLAIDGIISFSTKPLRMASWLGFLCTLLGLCFAIYVVYLKFIEPQKVAQGWPTIIVVILIMGGVQLLILGVIGEYIGRIYTEIQNRPLYIISEKINFEG